MERVSINALAGYEPLSRSIPMVCTLCWATVDRTHTKEHTTYHENVERVPGILPGYPASTEYPLAKD